MRKCHRCGVSLEVCNGFVKAGDVLQILASNRRFEDIRELCNKCTIPVLFMDEVQMLKYIEQIYNE